MKSKILISKDILRSDYLSIYGNSTFETKNIDTICKNGTLFNNYYTGGPSSGMSQTVMFTGMNIHEIDRGYFHKVKQFDQCETLYQIMEKKGYETHVLWDKKWYYGSRRKAMVYSENTNFHNLEIAQHVGPHGNHLRKKDGRIRVNNDSNPVKDLLEEIDKIISESKSAIFLWIHLPHVLLGYNGYGSDIQLFDEFVGYVIDKFKDQEIYLTSDHGHMNLERGIPCYGSHVYQGTIKIPFITNKFFGKSIINDNYSNVQLKDILLNDKITPPDFVYSDSHYFLQPNRKLAIIKDEFKYIFSKKGSSEELYDLMTDPNETVNLLSDKIFDAERLVSYFLDEVYHYPKWDKAEKYYTILKNEKKRVWKQGSWFAEKYINFREFKQAGVIKKTSSVIRPKKIIKGRWGSRAKVDLSKK
tara:strand:- start:22203 stop:23447 length:1245 start_codon:yes stop_codon:yes gene_type:complete